MAKKDVEVNEITPKSLPDPILADKTPQQALKDDWQAKHKELAPYITAKGRIRGNLKPSDKAKAIEILERYGF